MASDHERDDALFVNLVMIFQGAAMQQLGKIASPLSGKVERNLEEARFSIDTLAMLREKTRGNLSDDLARLLDSTLLNLRMNYVEEASADAGAGGDTAGASEAAGGGAAAGEAKAPDGGRTGDVVGQPEGPDGSAAGGGADGKASEAPKPEERPDHRASGPRGGARAKRGGKPRPGEE